MGITAEGQQQVLYGAQPLYARPRLGPPRRQLGESRLQIVVVGGLGRARLRLVGVDLVPGRREGGDGGVGCWERKVSVCDFIACRKKRVATH